MENIFLPGLYFSRKIYVNSTWEFRLWTPTILEELQPGQIISVTEKKNVFEEGNWAAVGQERMCTFEVGLFLVPWVCLLLCLSNLVEVVVFPKDTPCHLSSLLRCLLHVPRAHGEPRCGLHGSLLVLSHECWKPPALIQVCRPGHLHSNHPQFPQNTMLIHVFAQVVTTACSALPAPLHFFSICWMPFDSRSRF